ncbi:MAG: UDP-N-acetylglucosamine 2-epimerase [Anaerolineae bacterium]|nr:UDP-N-acetylglucosamine 2-epimerase [Anaerolineae bacterium]
MQELDRQGIKYNFIDAGQHASITGDLMRQFKLREPDIRLRQSDTSITTLFQAAVWTAGSLFKIIFRRNQIFERVFRGQNGICLIHGDTLTTLLSLFYAKRCGLKVAHVEAGLRSYHLFDPFPEEIIRLLAMRYSDVLFSPSDWASRNLKKMGYWAKTIEAGGNTGLDAVRYARQSVNGYHQLDEAYVVMTTHRVETIYSKTRLEMIASLIDKITAQYKVLFVLHEPTRHQLTRFKLYDKIAQNPAVEMLPLQPYLKFMAVVSKAQFIVTDGGSIQEESYFLNVPCLIVRSKTERMEGIGENAFLAEFNPKHVDRFFELLPTLKRKAIDESLSPSRVIIDNVKQWS